MAFRTPIPNASTFNTIPESVWHCCKCQTTNPVFDHPVRCSVCLNEKCVTCTDDNRSSNSWRPVEFSRETAKYRAFPPRDNEAGEAGEAGKVSNELTGSPPQPSSPKRPKFPKVSEKILEQIAGVTPQAIRLDVARVTRDNPDINVLQGYRPNVKSDLTPAQYFKKLDFFYKLPQFPHSTGLYKGEKIHYGFNPGHLDAQGALFKQNALPNNLNNPIHEIFDINHWTNTEDSIYKVLEPSLRLASMFLQQPVAFQVS